MKEETKEIDIEQNIPSKRFFWRNVLLIVVVVFVAVVLIRTFVFETFFVQGDSMAPTIVSGELLFINRLAYINSEPKRGDIIVAIPRTYPGRVIKRVVGIPGDWFSIENQRIVIANSIGSQGVILDEPYLVSSGTPEIGITKTNIDPGEYFVLGDNRSVSVDSRELGPIDKWSIEGKVLGVFNFSSMQYKGL